jgi:hypothetical protein
MTITTTILLASGIVSLFIFIAVNCIQDSIYYASFRIFHALDALTEKLDEINNSIDKLPNNDDPLNESPYLP